jgi:Na+-driven multidrug efflux pump
MRESGMTEEKMKSVNMGIIFGVNIIFLMTALGIGDGMQPIIGFNYGAKKIIRSNKTLIYALVYAETAAVLALLIIEIFPLQIADLFIENDVELAKIVQPALKLFAMSIPFYMSQIIITRYFQAIHKQKLATSMALLRPLILFVPILYISNWYWGVNGIWVSFAISDSIAALIAFLFLKKSFTENKKIAPSLRLIPNLVRSKSARNK